MQLRRLAALERNALLSEYEELIKKIAELEDLLANPRKIDFVVRDDIIDLKKKYGDARRTEIVEADAEDFREEDLIAHQDSVITLSIRNYIKRMPLEEFRQQRRGAVGAKGAPTREEDAVMKLVVCDTHDNLLFFTDKGKVYHLRGYDVPGYEEAGQGPPHRQPHRNRERRPRHRHPRRQGLQPRLHPPRHPRRRDQEDQAQRVRRGPPQRQDRHAPRTNGDQLIAARMAAESTQVILVSSEGQAILFKIDDLRQASRTSGGVRGMKLAKGGYVVGVETLDDGRTAPHHLRERLRQAHASARNTRSRAAAARA
ncbi:MAG: hypothetical protein IPL66_16450 [Dehalococcoidia bacterium]|nr:hypothetical protein [Dehalococcoidia bacterium]